MAVVRFTTSVKYKGVRHIAHSPFEIDDDDLDKLVEAGAHIIVQPKPAKEPEPEKESEKEVKPRRVKTLQDVVENQNKE